MDIYAFLDNKYTRLYFKIISIPDHKESGYTELHHIIPKSLGGSNSKTNLVRISARKHFICHYLLTKMTDGRDRYKMYKALWTMGAMDKYK
jgi:hypothetical protein